MWFAATFIDPYLAGSEEAIDKAAGNAFQLAEQVVVDALPCTFCIDFNQSDAGFRGTVRHARDDTLLP
jgi:hypothetical protein